MRRRRGYSLMECLAALALFSAVMAAVTAAIHGMHKSNRHVRDEAATAWELGRFAAQLREDAHQAQSVAVDRPAAAASPPCLALTLPEERTAQYTIEAHRIARVLRRGPTVLGREAYRLPAASAGHWQVAEGDHPMISLVLEQPPSHLAAVQPAVSRIDAAVRLFPSVPGGRR